MLRARRAPRATSLRRPPAFGRARLSALRRGSRRRAYTGDSVQAARHAIRRVRALPAPLTAPKPSTWHAGLATCRRGRCPDRPGTVYETVRGNRARSINRPSPVDAPSTSERFFLVRSGARIQEIPLAGRMVLIHRRFSNRAAARVSAVKPSLADLASHFSLTHGRDAVFVIF